MKDILPPLLPHQIITATETVIYLCEIMKNNGKILFLAAVHGDETFTIKIIKKLEKEFPGQFDWLIANEKAVERGARYVKTDLNRCAPGFKYSRNYERRRAFQILNKAKDYEAVIDLHGTDAETGVFVIITRPKAKNVQLAKTVPVKNVVLWESEKNSGYGPLTKFVDCGVEIECGPKQSRGMQSTLFKTIRNMYKNIDGSKNRGCTEKNYFQVYGKLPCTDSVNSAMEKLDDFKNARISGESFYPLLVNQYKEKGILCYKMRKLKYN